MEAGSADLDFPCLSLLAMHALKSNHRNHADNTTPQAGEGPEQEQPGQHPQQDNNTQKPKPTA
jgi:hypothetical protein